jgi:chromosome segregation ATPase
MPLNVTATLRKTLAQLERERARLDQQITTVRTALAALEDRRAPAVSQTRRQPIPRKRQLTAAARRAISQRMKAYWAKRRAASAKGKANKVPTGA